MAQKRHAALPEVTAADWAGDLHAAAHTCLTTADPEQKQVLTRVIWEAWQAGRLKPSADALPPMPIDTPGRPTRPPLVGARQLPDRGLGSREGRFALVHAIAHIEFNAINLAWDAVYRFRGLPPDYYADWVSCARDEARHFAMLQRRLGELGGSYGDLHAHNGLWEMAVKTADDFIARMALVPRVLEARGLDVTPGMIERLYQAGDKATVQILEVILREEIAHVAAGTRWYRYGCEQAGCDPLETFIALVERYMGKSLRGPFNLSARQAAGFLPEELDRLAALAV